MKKLLTLTTLIFTLMFSSTSFADWTKLGQTTLGTYYIDYERIRKHIGHLYFWYLRDNLRPIHFPSFGHAFSEKIYVQVDCELFQYKKLSWIRYKYPMGEGYSEIDNDRPWEEFVSPEPAEIYGTMLREVCKK